MFRKTLIAAIFFSALAIPVLAQRPRLARPGQGQGQAREPRIGKGGNAGRVPRNRGQGLGLGRIQKALNLTADQTNSLQALVQSRQPSMRALAQEARQQAQILKQLQDQPSPNPTELGNAMLAVKAAREKIQAAREELWTSFRNLLTTDQQATLDGLKRRRQ